MTKEELKMYKKEQEQQGLFKTKIQQYVLSLQTFLLLLPARRGSRHAQLKDMQIQLIPHSVHCHFLKTCCIAGRSFMILKKKHGLWWTPHGKILPEGLIISIFLILIIWLLLLKALTAPIQYQLADINFRGRKALKM